jgi:formate dehydrogenase major subunit
VQAVKAAYEADGGQFPDPILHLDWNYNVDEHGEPDIHMVAKEINGQFTRDCEVSGKQFKKGDQVPSFTSLQADGSTTSGNWLYCNAYTGPDKKDNKMARREKEDAINQIGLYPNWSWCWPVNRRIIYNRASVDLYGNPWDSKRWVIRWNPALKDGAGGWEGDVPDGGWPPMLKPDGTANESTKRPFIMRPEGVACVFSTSLNDGPFPEHYEPLESPLRNPMSSQQYNPAIKVWEPDQIGDPSEYPIVATTYRVSEHWQAGNMTRNIPWLVELIPNVFVEMSPALARAKGVKHGDWVRVITKRGTLEARALVTNRFEPFFVGGKYVHQIGIPWHWGYNGLATGDSANMLTPHVGDANTMIPEYKAFLCQLEKGRRQEVQA